MPVRLMLPMLAAAAAATATAGTALAAATLSASEARNRAEYGAIARIAGHSPPPLLLRDLAPKDALAVNRQIPLSTGPNPSAAPFRFEGDSLAYYRALTCLAAAIYYEAGKETAAGKYAVAQVVLNRVRHPAFAKSVCGVVYEGSTRRTGCQFTFTCDGSLRRRPSASSWRQSLTVAKAALDGAVLPAVGYATHYHANYVVPYWATSLSKNAVIGTHIFYRWPAAWGRPGAFKGRYAGRELDPHLLRQAALGRSAPDESHAGQLAVESDPRVELASVVDFLARNEAEAPQDTVYRHQIRTYFWSNFDHGAVRMYRQLHTSGVRLSLSQLAQIIMHHSAPPGLEPRSLVPAELVHAAGGQESLTRLMSALRDFAAQTDFQRFWQDQQPIYAEMAARAQERPATLMAANDAILAPTPAETPRVILAPLLQDSVVAGCELPSDGASTPWLMVATNRVSDERVHNLLSAGVRCEVRTGDDREAGQAGQQQKLGVEPRADAALAAARGRRGAERVCGGSGCKRARDGDRQRRPGPPE